MCSLNFVVLKACGLIGYSNDRLYAPSQILLSTHTVARYNQDRLYAFPQFHCIKAYSLTRYNSNNRLYAFTQIRCIKEYNHDRLYELAGAV